MPDFVVGGGDGPGEVAGGVGGQRGRPGDRGRGFAEVADELVAGLPPPARLVFRSSDRQRFRYPHSFSKMPLPFFRTFWADPTRSAGMVAKGPTVSLRNSPVAGIHGLLFPVVSAASEKVQKSGPHSGPYEWEQREIRRMQSKNGNMPTNDWPSLGERSHGSTFAKAKRADSHLAMLQKCALPEIGR